MGLLRSWVMVLEVGGLDFFVYLFVVLGFCRVGVEIGGGRFVGFGWLCGLDCGDLGGIV